jgi:type IV pilus assembly protein PilE
MPKQSGFTLIEMMITVAIVALLAAVALPSHQSYVMRGRIPDATGHLSTKRVQMEQAFQDNRSYLVPPAPAGNLDTTSSQFFNFSAQDDGGAETRTATGYTLFARGKGAMTGFTYTINQANVRTSTVTGVSGWEGNAACWVTKKGGQC